VQAAQRAWEQRGVVVREGVLRRARVQESSRSGGPGWLHADAIAKWGACPGTRAQPVGQPAWALDDDGVGREVAAVSA
jgi:hypothetical protein